MAHVTGIELGPSSCVLVSARRNGATEVGVVQAFDVFDSRRLTDALLFARRSGRLPRRARLVSWALTGPATPDDPARHSTLKPFLDAGFTIEALLTPAQALAQLAAERRRPNEGPVAWLSINTHGAAIAIVEGIDILYSRTLAWKYNHSPRTAREQLLQRYVLVMHIAPELQHGISVVRVNQGKRVETVVTCGNLPDLRSLTMPLIEELDMEVETLDSTDGLRPVKSISTEALAERAPIVRLASAAAVMPVENRRASMVPAVAAAILLVAGGWLAASALRLNSNRNQVSPPVHRDADMPPAPAAPQPAPQAVAPDVRVPPPALPSVPTPAASSGSGPASAAVGGLGSAQGASQAPAGRTVTRLPSVPAVTSILVDGTRKVALIGGEIVTVGDFVGPRVVVRIDQRFVVLREPSGAEITVLLSDRHSDGVKLPPFASHGRSPSTRTQAAR